MFFRGDLARAFPRASFCEGGVHGFESSGRQSGRELGNYRGMAKAAGAIQLTALDFPFNGFGRVPHYIRIAPVE
jgi:hypothetical protein